ncbi:YkgJ family cysteine cluster protein [Nannocystaceae bacterium ST9]
MPSHEDALVESARAFITRPDGTLALRLAAAAEALLDERGRQTPAARERACESGCDYCCHMPVSLSMPEALAIHAHVVQTWTAAERERLVGELAEAASERVAANGAIDRAIEGAIDEDALFLSRRPCVFLREARCSIYSVRPLACRGHASFARQACADAHAAPDDLEIGERVPVDLELRAAKNAMKTTLGIVMLQAELHAIDCELTSLLGRLFDEPDAERAWLAGADLVAHLDCHALSSAQASLAELIELAHEV